MSPGEKLRQKWQAKVDALDARMEELKALPYNDEVYEEMLSVMCETNRILRAMGKGDSGYDI